MTDLEYNYKGVSTYSKTKGINNLVLAHQTEIEEVNNIPCFFWGSLTDPYVTAKCWSTIAKVVRSSFGPIPPSLRDPIVSAGSERLRFEGFSSCNGVYVRLDMKPEAVDGEFIANGTTNVDFNDPMLNALNAIQKNEKVTLAVGQQDVQVITSKAKVVEKKVTLPMRWIKGLTSVQLYLADMDLKFELNKIQTIQLFQSLPKGNVKGDFFITKRAGKFMFSTLATADSVRIGGVQRLRLLEGILAIVDKIFIYESDDKQTCAVVCEFGKMQLLMAFSPDSYRGFSGEGNVLETMTENLPIEWIYGLNSLLKSNEMFDPTMLSIENDIDFGTMDNLTSNLSSMGLLGYDLSEKAHFYRRLPFKTERILSLNPRLKNAKKLIDNEEVEIVERKADYIEAKVKGSGVVHKVIIDNTSQRCTCDWFTAYQGKRGICKHILAVKMTIS
ncbi:SWIM zinc finger domain-containing protein [Flavobacterium sp. KACC 22758]|uniref:SWIM zinc finger family protein n=1 Tax=Flavobacterium sp. KACC 22758 TaxID=3025667 RepID=UPI002366F4F4|nr:SWIM zinc finger family protein [Flavobacterium sp. KACC 22758]WDF58474.1 SWIM zinc finger domain-containing protein [Flavobacterium sp. KACC 22758]